MKYVTFLFTVALIGIAGTASATEATPFSFGYSNQNAYYSCDYATQQAEKTLKKLGATVVAMDCDGGIEYGTLLPVSLNGGFILEPQGVRTVVLKGRESCEFNVKLIKNILATIPHQVVKDQSSCWDAQGRYNYEVILN